MSLLDKIPVINVTALEKAVEIIKKFEGCVLKAYPDPSSQLGEAVRKAGFKIWDYEKLKGWEKLKANPWTIGWGSTFYLDNRKVKPGDTISQVYADAILNKVATAFMDDVKSLVTSKINDNQLAALTSFAYNVGPDIDADTIPEGLGDSTLLKYVNANPDDERIRDEFAKWNKSGGKVTPGLVKRRAAEADLYFTK